MTNLITTNIIDLSDNQTTASALTRFEDLLDSSAYSNKPLSLVLGSLVFTHGHMARLKSLADNNNISIDLIYCSATQTQLAALNSGLSVSEKPPGDTILEEFKNSLTTMDSNSSMDVTNNNSEINLFNDTNYNKQENIMQEVQNVDSFQEIVSTGNFSQESEFKRLNDVVEILNQEEVMVQQKIDLPFERKSDITHSLKFNSPESEASALKTLYINQTLRSGQMVCFEGNVIIAGDTHPGSEVKASGDIVVWGTLGGIAHAGASNNYKASIRALKMNPIQLRIADYIARRPDKNVDFNQELPLKPEVARISNGEIRIFSLK